MPEGPIARCNARCVIRTELPAAVTLAGRNRTFRRTVVFERKADVMSPVSSHRVASHTDSIPDSQTKTGEYEGYICKAGVC